MAPTRQQLLDWLESEGAIAEVGRFARRISDEPDDLVQDTLLRILKGSRDGEPDPSFSDRLVKAWVFTIMRRAAVDRLRQQNRRGQGRTIYADIDNLEGANAELFEPFDIAYPAGRALTKAIQSLTKAEQRVVNLLYFKGYRIAEAARELRVSSTAIAKIHSTALRKLLRVLGASRP